ncbi:hypothetical protein ACFLYT_01830 [Nanoarchaeota archaeon]
MKKIVLLVLVLIFIMGCSAAPKFICPDGETIVDEKSKCPSTEQETETEFEQVIEPAVISEKQGTVPEKVEEDVVESVISEAKPVAKPSSDMDDDLKKILDRIEKVTSYEFTYQYGTQEVMKYTVVGDKVKATLMYGNLLYDKHGYYDYVLMDAREKTAIAYCVDRGACVTDDKKIAKNVPYEDFEMVIDPVKLAKSIVSAEITGEFTCDDDRACTIIKFRQDGEDVEAHIDNFYGFPYYWLKGDVEHKFSGVVYMPRDPGMILPEIITEII